MKRTSKNIITADKLSLVLSSLQPLKNDPRFGDLIVPIIERSSNISLRTLEHFVLNYSKKYRVSYRENDHNIVFYYPDYKANLTSFPKKLFDPFRRTEEDEKIAFEYGTEGKYVMTTVGQLNFFKWALQYRLIEYVQQHLVDIERDKKLMKHQKKLDQSSSSSGSSSSTSSSIDDHHRKRKPPCEEWPIYSVESPQIPTHGWHSASPSSVDP